MSLITRLLRLPSTLINDILRSKYSSKILIGYSLFAALVILLLLTTILSWGSFPVWYWFALLIPLSVVIWRACEPFSEASFFLGKNIPGSVRGATIDAIASSMPEFFTVMFFLFVFGTFESGIATCAGSAIYNMIVIPAVCTFFIFNYRKLKGLDTDLIVEKEVLYRDGLYFLFSEIVLISFISQGELTWWMGATLLVLYGGYSFWLWMDARKHSRHLNIKEEHAIDKLGSRFEKAVLSRDLLLLLKIWPDFQESDFAMEFVADPEEFWQGLGNHISTKQKIKRGKEQNGDIREVRAQGGEVFSIDYTGEQRLGMLRLYTVWKEGSWEIESATKYEHTKRLAWLIIFISTAIVAGACYFLTLSCENIAVSLDITPFFVAVIVAAAATSVPDTFLSLLSARKGDDSGAVSNAFGSNIFDINVGLGGPLLIWTLMKGPVAVEGHGVREVRIILLVFSLITLVLFAFKLKLTRMKAVILFFLYFLFMLYVVASGWFGFTLEDMTAYLF